MDTVERITVAMAELLRRQGYRATGIVELARAAEAPTGSIYHHFKGGKRAVAAAALRRSGAAYLALLPMLLDPHDDLAEGIKAAFAAAAEDVESSGWINLCPVGTCPRPDRPTRSTRSVPPTPRHEARRGFRPRGASKAARRRPDCSSAGDARPAGRARAHLAR